MYRVLTKEFWLCIQNTCLWLCGWGHFCFYSQKWLLCTEPTPKSVILYAKAPSEFHGIWIMHLINWEILCFPLILLHYFVSWKLVRIVKLKYGNLHHQFCTSLNFRFVHFHVLGPIGLESDHASISTTVPLKSPMPRFLRTDLSENILWNTHPSVWWSIHQTKDECVCCCTVSLPQIPTGWHLRKANLSTCNGLHLKKKARTWCKYIQLLNSVKLCRIA